MKRDALYLVLAMMACAQPAMAQPTNSAPSATNAQSVRALVAKVGAPAAVKSLYGAGEENSRWNYVESQIAAGGQEWLDLVGLLTPGTDGVTAEGMTIAISKALAHNAAGVLRLVSSDRPIEQVCAWNAIEPTPQETAQFKKSTINSVQAVTAPELQSLKSQCLTALRRIR